MKGIMLAGGLGTRLYPTTQHVSKQLLPIYDKPMIYYPLTTLMLAGIREVLIIATPQDLPMFKQLLADGSQWGLEFTYAIQPSPDGLAQAFIIGKEFVGKNNVCLILGDNIFWGHGLSELLQKTRQNFSHANVLTYYVNDPQRYGVAVFNKQKKLIDIEEKPKKPRSHYAITGLYFYDNQVIDIAQSLKPSIRNELEITDINKIYLSKNQLQVTQLPRGFAWLDTGTSRSLLEASQYFAVLEERQGLKVACPEEIAWRMRYITSDDLYSLIKPIMNSSYGQYLLKILEET